MNKPNQEVMAEMLPSERKEYLRQFTGGTKLYSVFVTEDDGDGEQDSIPFHFVYATRELAKKAIEEHVQAYIDDVDRTKIEGCSPTAKWADTGVSNFEVYVVFWPATGAWAELRIDEVTLVA